MRFNKLDDAISLVNQTGYGLTSGLESLDEREQARWKAGIRAGNLYINRPTTGAIVLRQPFGGIGKSAFGPGIKAGGPNYVALFMNFADADAPAGDPPTDPLVAALCSSSPVAAPLLAASKSYSRWFREEFGIEHDHFRLIGQDNIRRYLSVSHLRIRVHPDDSAFAILARVCAARIAGCHTTVSVPPGSKSDVLRLLSEQIEFWGGRIEWVEENDEQVAAAIRERQVDRVRCAAPGRVSPEVHRAAADTGVCIVSQPVLAEGRVELLWYLQEQSISFDYHRYGNLGARAGEDRAKAL
jgi:RHH-type proline utilization regulon transcriptional repressor/proline dehydrogenase/delta 1-pyrroline-5-carboxylate dehydrogenase